MVKRNGRLGSNLLQWSRFSRPTLDFNDQSCSLQNGRRDIRLQDISKPCFELCGAISLVDTALSPEHLA